MNMNNWSNNLLFLSFGTFMVGAMFCFADASGCELGRIRATLYSDTGCVAKPLNNIIVWLEPDSPRTCSPLNNKSDGEKAELTITISNKSWEPLVSVVPPFSNILIANKSDCTYIVTMPDMFLSAVMRESYEPWNIEFIEDEQPRPPSTFVDLYSHSTTRLSNIPSFHYPVLIRYMFFHPLMDSHCHDQPVVFCAPTPYFSVSDRKGMIDIGGVPPGKYAMVFWSPSSGLISKALFQQNHLSLKQGKVSLPVYSGLNNIGIINATVESKYTREHKR